MFCMSAMHAADQFVSFEPKTDNVCLSEVNGNIVYDAKDWKGVKIAIDNLKVDLEKVTGRSNYAITIGTIGKSAAINKAIKKNPAIAKELKGKNEKFIITYIDGVGLVIAGSDKRGTIYGIYELSQQIGVSPWYYWADAPVQKHSTLYINKGLYTDGEPAVKYRGIFLNDEAPALTGWVKQNFDGYNHEFYSRVFELVLRLKGNFMWPAMWDAAFYADDEINMQTADDMGVMMGTSHHEPMGRAHKEWTRVKGRGAWNYDTNKKELDEFWQSGVERLKNTEDVVTVGMRGNGDEPMGENVDVALLERIVKNQREQIAAATGKPAKETPQVWALYKEVQEYYEKGMKVPDDVILLLCDDNWGNVRILPELDGKAHPESPWAKRHPGGYGMYYHVDYVGAPRNSKWINISQVQRMWEQLQLTYTYGVDKLWILNVGDLKPMEFPIDFWFKMAWNPSQFNASNLQEYTEEFCRQQFGSAWAEEIARILNLQGKYIHRRTAEQLDDRTYNLSNGEWDARLNEYVQLESDALDINAMLPEEARDAYYQLVLYPVQAMANLYKMYYSVAMNKYYAARNDKRANAYADKVEMYFKRDSELSNKYHNINNGKWNHFASQVHIGYRSWNDPREQICPKVTRIDANAQNVADASPVVKKEEAIVIEADEYVSVTANSASAANTNKATWQVIPDMGIYKSAIALFPYTEKTDGAYVEYEFSKFNADKAEVTICFATTFPFNSGRGQKVEVSIDGGEKKVININEASKYVVDAYHDMNYEWEKTRVNKQKLSLPFASKADGKHRIKIAPLDPGVVIERIEIR